MIVILNPNNKWNNTHNNKLIKKQECDGQDDNTNKIKQKLLKRNGIKNKKNGNHDVYTITALYFNY